MSTLSYHQLIKLIRQLSREEIKKLTHTLQTEISAKKNTSSIQELVLQAPTWSEPNYNNFQEARIHINKSRNRNS